MAKQKESGIGVRSFVTVIVIIFALMCLTYLLTFLIPSGEYDRTVDESGMTVIDGNSYRAVDGGLPFWKWLLSPLLALTAEGILIVGIAVVFSSAFLPALQDYTMIIVALVFLLSGILATLTAGDRKGSR